jgi:periplasmic protein TonB
MFGDTLLESSAAARKRKRWPMATAFTAEIVVAAIIVLVPLLSTGVIPVSARVPIYTPHITVEPVERPVVDRTDHSGPVTPASGPTRVILVNNTRDTIYAGPQARTTEDPNLATPGSDGPRDTPNLFDSASKPNVRPGGSDSAKKVVVSTLEEARLVYRVEPVYPGIALKAGVQGQVRLHAIIARNGTIESLNVISGHPLLLRAAMDAVGQWRYRPYVLNGEVVEVETFITVNFRKSTQ